MFGSREPKPGKLDDQRILMDIIGFAMFYCFVCVCVFTLGFTVYVLVLDANSYRCGLIMFQK